MAERDTRIGYRKQWHEPNRQIDWGDESPGAELLAVPEPADVGIGKGRNGPDWQNRTPVAVELTDSVTSASNTSSFYEAPEREESTKPDSIFSDLAVALATWSQYEPEKVNINSVTQFVWEWLTDERAEVLRNTDLRMLRLMGLNEAGHALVIQALRQIQREDSGY